MAEAFAALREAVFRANGELAGSGLVHGTFGNVSGVDRAAGVFLIKPSGVPYSELTPAHMVPVSLETGKVVDSPYRPSSDTPTHLELYRAFALRRRSCTRTRRRRPPSRRRGCRSAAWARRTPTTSAATCP
jgi:L-ribulose-5-phosphate 4-epimerase